MSEKNDRRPAGDETASERLARRKKAFENRRRKLNLLVTRRSVNMFLLFMCVMTVLLLVVPRSRISNIEKRQLAAWPKFSIKSLLSGEYTTGLSQYYNDTVPFRDTFKNVNSQFKAMAGIQSGEDMVQTVGNLKKVNKTPAETAPAESAPADGASAGTAADSTESANAADGTSAADGSTAASGETASAATPAPAAQTDYTKEEAEGEYSDDAGMLIVNVGGHWRGLELFGGGTGSTFASAMNELAARVEGSARVYAMPVPIASEFYTPANFADYTASQEQCFDTMFSKLNANVEKVEVIDNLKAHTEEDIYTRTDHHWSSLGAYYATEVFAQVAGIEYPSLDAYTKKSKDGYLGSMYAESQSALMLNDPEQFIWYDPPVDTPTDYYDTSFNFDYTADMLLETDTPNSYMMFLGSDDQITVTHTPVKNGRKCAVVKDSFGNAIVPFLTSGFEDIYCIDMRYFDPNLADFVIEQGITDVVVCCCSFSVAGPTAEELYSIVCYN